MTKTYTLQQLADLIQAELKGNPNSVISSVAPLETAQTGQLSYLVGGAYKKFLSITQATAVILTADQVAECSSAALIVKNPELSFAKIAALFQRPQAQQPGIHPSAIVADSCHIDPTASIGPHCVIEDEVRIGANTIVMAGSIIGARSIIGDHCILHRHVTLYSDVVLGNRVYIHSGAVIGADGFGYTQDQGQWVKIPQLGRVHIEDDVEIGANTSIDRGALRDTIIRRGVKIDNLVQVAHNVEIGDHTIIAGCVAIAGSSKIGRHCMIGGGANINGHIKLSDQVMLSGTATAFNSIERPGIYASGIDARPVRQWFKTLARIHQLDDLAKQIKKMEKVQDD